MKIFAHRGFSEKYPENTLIAFEKALKTGVDGIELDVHLSKDGIPVIIHDEQLFRTTGVRGFVNEFSFEDLKRIGKIPSLDEYCSLVKDYNIETNIELKTNIFWYQDIEEKVLKIVQKYFLEEKIIFSSFNWASVLRMKELSKLAKFAFLQEGEPLKNIEGLSEKLGIDYYHPSICGMSKEIVDNLHNKGIKVNVWTINTVSDIERVVSFGVDGIITNNPSLCKELLNN